MAKLKPWYKVVTPREDLREGRSCAQIIRRDN